MSARTRDAIFGSQSGSLTALLECSPSPSSSSQLSDCRQTIHDLREASHKLCTAVEAVEVEWYAQ